METLPITLIVKAPNQQIEDQQIKCELSWTINKLKQHLSEVYPSKPPKHEQKLIYSGQLLSDSVTLKDVLRQYEGQETHTVHLVCTTQQQNRSPQRTNQSTTTTTTTRPVITEQLPQTPPNTPISTTIGENTQTTTITTGQNMPNLWPNLPFDPNQFHRDPNQYAMQLAMMQQAYLQYMTQYMQLAASSYGVTQNQYVQNENIQQQQQQQPEPEPAAIVRDPDNPERDWLDIFYMLSRVMILFSVVYFYSSPIRFIFVLLLGFALYLYQIGFFRNINNNNNNNNNINNNNNNNRVPGNNDPIVAGQEQQQQSERQQQQQEQQEEQAPSRLMVIWTFFTTFFASLIPEIPNAV